MQILSPFLSRGRLGLACALLSIAGAAQSIYFSRHATAHPAPRRNDRLRHLTLRVRPNFAARTIAVRETLTIQSRQAGLRRVRLDARGPVIQEMSEAAEGRRIRLHYQQTKRHLQIRLAQAARAGEKITLRIRYQARPDGCMIFYPGDLRRPNRITNLWVSGEPECNRRWLPIYDHPDAKLSVDFYLDTPPGLSAIANGQLMATRALPDGWREFHWRQAQPIAPYLITFYMGRWRQARAAGPGGVPLFYDVRPDESAADAQTQYGRTPRMMAYFERLTGVPFPWAKYAQVENPGFFSGLENASATEFPGNYPQNADRANLRAQARRRDIEIAHELAHQWFGDLATCRNWSDLWLNEGFANFMMYIWDQHANGKDRAVLDRHRDALQLFAYERQVRRPIVDDRYTSPWGMFDPVTYNEGSWVLRQLRYQLGAKQFWRAIHAYLLRYRFRSPDTRDFERVIEQSTHRNLRPFFQQWLYRAGYPVFQGRWRWRRKEQKLEIRLRQKQKTPRVYTGAITVGIWSDGKEAELRLQLSKRNQKFLMAQSSRPQMVLLDPGHEWLKRLSWKQPARAWLYQARRAPFTLDREDALRHLERHPGGVGAQAVTGLLQAAAANRNHANPLRRFALRQLARRQPGAAGAMGLRWLCNPHPAMRQAGAEVWASLPATPASLAGLRRLYFHDPIAAVRVAALRALLRPRTKNAAARDWKYIQAGLRMHSYRWQVESECLRVLGRWGANQAAARRRAAPMLEAWAAVTRPPAARSAAITALGEWPRTPRSLQLVEQAFASPDAPLQLSAARVLAHWHIRGYRRVFRQLAAHDWIGFYRPAYAALAR